MLKRKIKVLLGLTVLSCTTIINKQNSEAMFKKVITNIARATSSTRSVASNNTNELLTNTARGNKITKLNGSYSSQRSNLENIRNKNKLITDTLTGTSEGGKIGNFKTSDGQSVDLKIFMARNDEGLEYEAIFTSNNQNIPVVTADGKNYNLVLGPNELLPYVELHKDKFFKAYDSLGRENFVVISNGDNDPIVYQFELGIFRYLLSDENGKLHLGQKVDLNKLSDPVKNNLKKIIASSSSYALNLDVDLKVSSQEFSTPTVNIITEASTSSPNLPILTTKQISDFEKENPGLVMKVFDKNGNKQPVLILDGDGGERVAYNLSDGKFSKVQLSKKKNLTLTEGVKKEDVSSNDIERLKSMLPRDAVQSAEQGAIGGGISVPKLSLQQINDIKSEHSNLITLLKDADGKDLDVIVVNASGEKVAYNLKEGTVGNIVTGKKGKEMVKGQVDPNTLSAPLKDGLEDLFSKLNIGYTKTGDSTTVGSRIVGGARRKTTLKPRTTSDKTGRTSLTSSTSEVDTKKPQKVLPVVFEKGKKIPEELKESMKSEKADVFTASGNVEHLNVYTAHTNDEIPFNFIINGDGSITKVTYLGGKYIVVLNSQQLNKYSIKNQGEVILALDGSGNPQPVLIFETSTGTYMAYQPFEGLFRNAIKFNDKWNLLGKVDISTLPEQDNESAKAIIFKLAVFLQE